MTSPTVLPYEARHIVCAVAQKPFVDMHENTFCTLVPLLLDDGRRLQRNDFPSNGLIWWKLLVKDRALAEPGRLINVKVEESREAGKPGKDDYQVVRNSAAEGAGHGFTEVIEVSDQEVSDQTVSAPAGLLSHGISLKHCPSSVVHVIWRKHLFGPLRASIVEGGTQTYVRVRFKPLSQTPDTFLIQRLPVAKSEFVRRALESPLEARVSLNDHPVHMEDSQPVVYSYFLVPATDLLRDMKNAEEVSVEPDTHIIKRISKQLLQRNKRQQLNALLDELDDELGSKPSVSVNDEKMDIARVRSAIQANDEGAQQLAEAIVNAGLLQSQIAASVTHQVDQRVKEIEQCANQRTTELRQRLSQLQMEEKTLADSIHRQKEQAAQELHLERRRIEEEMASVREELDRDQKDLKEREDRLEKHLKPVTERLESAGVDVVNQYLALLPLLANIGRPGVAGNPAISHDGSPQIVRSPRTQHAHPGEAISDWATFIEHRLWPVLADWTPDVSRTQAELLHVCLLGCMCTLVPNPSWGAAYATAVGGQFTLVQVEPNWISFHRAWDGDVKNIWQEACADSSVLHFLMFAGVDRSPTPAWALPMLGISGGLCDYLPVDRRLSWPENLRVLFTFDLGPANYAPSRDFVYAAGAPSPEPCGEDAATLGLPIAGHIAAGTWLAWARPQVAIAPDVFALGDLRTPKDGKTWLRSWRADTRQLMGILLSAGKKEETALRIAKKIRTEWPSEYVRQNDERD